MKAGLITVGDEILIGQIVDTNSSWMASNLAEVGVEVVAKLSVGDILTDIMNGLDMMYTKSDIVLMTGGLGPTKDDITKKALAEYFKSEMIFSQVTFDRITAIFQKRGIKMTEAHRDQCYLPSKALIIENKMGTAPGMWFEKDGKYLCSMPGVPHEMKYIMTYGVIPRLSAMSTSIYRKKTIRTCGIGESALAEMIEPTLEDHDVNIAYLPSIGQVRLRISKMGNDARLVEAMVDKAVESISNIIKPHIFGFDDDTLEQHVGQLLQEKKLTLATAESCTGGYLAHMITSVAGSSVYYTGSIIAYANEIKEKVLHVSPDTLDQKGAVSEQTVREMVSGILTLMNCDIAISVSGIAGPGGGTEEKPVGTVWIAVGDSDRIIAKRFLFTKDRIINIKYTAVYALDMLRKFLIGR